MQKPWRGVHNQQHNSHMVIDGVLFFLPFVVFLRHLQRRRNSLEKKCLEELHVKGRDCFMGNSCLLLIVSVRGCQPKVSCFSVTGESWSVRDRKQLYELTAYMAQLVVS